MAGASVAGWHETNASGSAIPSFAPGKCSKSTAVEVATALLVITAWILASQVPWIRNLLMLCAMLAIPLARIGAAPLALARNRHG